ncbi:hypothetical protein LK07_22550 [Streptomyces pluripotens]|uniref:Uncharacterized protein n=2 Tax=Streptomyces TaxID=1883 RepID=A0A221P8Q2_9ACTN|nr:hypothetical protein LK06_021395 [Streptomyces pluripotens]ASN28621.1 hypothetical protein LK07_22550 [Streptomyces pluripotens]KIE26571.1 hypothetical protein LK08_15050 [Streptomyces sp. MUSC 125]MCH0555939.1 hypothetical protein [Streptomyces sp. MUM 16J]
MNHTYKPPSVLPTAGQDRIYALLIAGVPLLLILLIGALPRLATDSTGSTGATVDSYRGHSYEPRVTRSAAPDTATTYSTAPWGPADGPDTTDTYPSPLDTESGLGNTGYPANPVSPVSTASAEDTAGAGATGPAATVVRYYAAINAHDFRTAWDRGGKNLAPSFSAFVSGFDKTEQDQVTVNSVQGTTVSVALLARQSDGSQKSYRGHYTVVNGIITKASMTPTG